MINRYKRTLKRVRHEARGSESSYSDLQSEYKSVRSSDANFRPSLRGKSEYWDYEVKDAEAEVKIEEDSDHDVHLPPIVSKH